MKKKIAYLAFGHVDVTANLVKSFNNYLNENITVIFIFSQNKKKESLVDFSKLHVKDGFQDIDQMVKILGKNLISYLGDNTEVKCFIYNNLKARSLKNNYLSLKLAFYLRSFNIIHFSGHDGTLLHLYPLLFFKKKLITIHDLFPHSGEGNKGHNLISKVSIKMSDRVIFQNKYDLDLGLQKLKLEDKSKYIPFGKLDIYSNLYKNNGQVKSTSDILFFGRLSQYKGLEVLIESLILLKDSGLEPKVIIAGSGTYNFGREKLKALNKVEFINRFIANDELCDYIEGTKIVVCPYTDATQSGVLATAFAFNKPVIASNVGGFPDIIKDYINGILISASDPDALASSINELLSNNELRETISRNIECIDKDLNNEFNWYNIVNKLDAVYKELI